MSLAGMIPTEPQSTQRWHREILLSVSDTDRKFLCDIANSNAPRSNHLRVNAAQMQLSSDRRVYKLHRVQPEVGNEFLAARVRWRCHFDHSRADRQLRSSGQVFRAQIHVEIKLIAGELPATFVLRDERSDASIHNVDLHVMVRRTVRSF